MKNNKKTHILLIVPFPKLLALFIKNRIIVSIRYISRFFLLMIQSLVLYPVLLLNQLFEKQKEQVIANTRIKSDPVFIIGHWRSGTTFLANVMAQDKNLGYLNCYQAITSNHAISASSNMRLKGIISRNFPREREFDKMQWRIDSPQEGEYAMLGLSEYTFYYALCFPSRIERLLKQYVLFKDENIAKKWRDVYYKFIKKISYLNNNKQLVLKNPVNTSRIKWILDIFPEAKFIYLARNPYDIYFSTLRLFKYFLENFSFQNYELSYIKEHILTIYIKILKAYYEQKQLIPTTHLVEIKFEDFIAQPVDTLKKIYYKINIGHFDKAKKDIQEYCYAERKYKKSEYSIDLNVMTLLKNKWNFGFDKWEKL